MSGPLKDWNSTTLIIGPPRYGKTTALRKVVIDHLTEHPTGLALVHDPNRQLRDVCAVYESAAEWRKAFDAHVTSGKPFCYGASIGGDGDDVRNAAIELGKSRNTADNVRIPILLGFDETSLLESSGPSHISKKDRALLSNRAHWGIGPVYNAQTVTALHPAFYGLATLVVVFSQPNERETEKLETLLGGIPEGTLRDLVMAPKFHHRRWVAGEGLV